MKKKHFAQKILSLLLVCLLALQSPVFAYADDQGEAQGQIYDVETVEEDTDLLQEDDVLEEELPEEQKEPFTEEEPLFENGVLEEEDIEEAGDIQDLLTAFAGEDDVYLGVDAGSELPDSYQNDIWTQYDFLEMSVGDTALLNPRRVPEAITNGVSNNVELPRFNYEIIKGDSIEIDETENAHAVVTAVKAGNAVVQITYDAFDHSAGTHFEASDPVNTAYVVYSVGGNEGISIETDVTQNGEEEPDKTVFRSYDTIYFTEGESVLFTIHASQTGAESLVVKCNGLTVPDSGDGTYVLPLENRSNIIELTATAADGTARSAFRVFDARKINVNVENKTNPGAELQPGDTAVISFTGITLPVYKLASIYNPTIPAWANGTFVEYTQDGTVYKGMAGQYTLATVNSFEVTFDQGGEYLFTEGKIFESWWGSALGADKTQNNPGAPNLNAPVTEDYFSQMPDFTISVVDIQQTKQDAVEKVDGILAELDLDDYTDEQKKKIDTIISEAKERINNAASEDEVLRAVNDAADALDPANLQPLSEAAKAKAKPVLRLKLRAGKNFEILSWNKIAGAQGYKIYGARAGDSYKLLKKVGKNTVTYTHSGLIRGATYKYYVVAYKTVDGKDTAVCKFWHAYSTTLNSTYGNAKAISVNKSSVSVKRGGTATVKATVTNSLSKVRGYVSEVRYISDNTAVATVNKNGVITGKVKGTCNVYCYAPNGRSVKVSVTVK